MLIFLLWQRAPREPPAAAVAARLQALFAPMLSVTPPARILEGASTSLVSLELPVQGWKPAPFEEDERGWALAPDYPVGAAGALAGRGAVPPPGGVLPALGRALQKDPEPLVRELAPPFALIWSDSTSGSTYVQNDGLGQAQLFEYDSDVRWALTNRVLALEALGLPVVPEPQEWAVRLTLGWFPLQTTGFRDIRYLEPAAQLALNRGRPERTRLDALGDWLHPRRLSRAECLELARQSLVHQIEAARALWHRPSVGLSGGWDSRAVMAVLRSLETEFTARVRAKAGRPDAVIAAELARRAGMELRTKPSTDVPLGGAEGYRRSLGLALRWQAGHMDTTKHRSFLADGRRLDGGVVNVMGQHGEIGRAYYAQKLRVSGRTNGRLEERLVARLAAGGPPYLRPGLRGHVREVIRAAFRQSDRYGLTGAARLDFFYLYERTRRWASGSLSSQTGLVFAPFLNPDYVRAVFGYPDADKGSNPFHRHIVATHAPEWAGVAYERDLRPHTEAVAEAAAEAWAAAAEPLVREALAAAGTWTQIFSPELAARRWREAPEALVMAHLLDQTVGAQEVAA